MTTLQELTQFQSSMVDKASTYSKIVLGIGYAGFFTAWSGTKQHLSPGALISSALCMTLSIVLYLIYEISQAGAMSYLAAQFSRIPMENSLDVQEALRNYTIKEKKITKRLMRIWPTIFLVSAVTGLGGAAILIGAFIEGLFKLH